MDFNSQREEYITHHHNQYYQLLENNHNNNKHQFTSFPSSSSSLSSSSSRTFFSFDLNSNSPSKYSFYICSLSFFYNVPLYIHITFPFLILFITFSSSSLLSILYSFILSFFILFGSVFLHELGHASMAIYFGGEVKSILLWPLGGIAYISMFGTSNPYADALIGIAGPLTHIPQLLFWYFCLYLNNNNNNIHHINHFIHSNLSWSNLFLYICQGAIIIQYILLLFNLLPAFPLDGGRILASILTMRNIEQIKVYQICAIISGITGSFIFTESLSNIITNSTGSNIYWGWNSFMISIFILLHSWNLWKASESGVKPVEYLD